MPIKRKWVKLWVTECLEGSIRYQLQPDERSVWYDLIIFSALCDPPGKIADRDGRAFPRQFIASRLNITEGLLESTIDQCTHEGRLQENDGVLIITNWERYQSEYDRQKPYRKGEISSDPEKFKKQKYGTMIKR